MIFRPIRCVPPSRFVLLNCPRCVLAVTTLLGVAASSATASDPWADRIESYSPGSGAATGYLDPSTALGSPTRITGDAGGFAASVTPFAAAYEPDEIVSIGRGGSMVVRFDEPVRNDAQNPFGVDLLIFGNSFFYDPSFSPVANRLWQPGGTVEVSADGVDWRVIPSVQPDGLFPTLAYSDETEAFGGAPGFVESDYTRPVDPAFSWVGKTLSEIVGSYNGSGGGAGVDIGLVGLSEVSFVRLSLAANAPVGKIDIDALSDVTPLPAPGAVVVLSVGLGASCGRRRRGVRTCGANGYSE